MRLPALSGHKRPRDAARNVLNPRDQKIVLHQSQMPSRHDMENRQQDQPDRSSTHELIDMFGRMQQEVCILATCRPLARCKSSRLSHHMIACSPNIDRRLQLHQLFLQLSRREPEEPPCISSVADDDDILVTPLDDSTTDRTPVMQPMVVTIPSSSQQPCVAPFGARNIEGGNFHGPEWGQSNCSGWQTSMTQPHVILPGPDTRGANGPGLQQGTSSCRPSYGGVNDPKFGQSDYQHGYVHGRSGGVIEARMDSQTSAFYDVANEAFSTAGNADMSTDLLPFNKDEYIRNPAMGCENANHWQNTSCQPNSESYDPRWNQSNGKLCAAVLKLFD